MVLNMKVFGKMIYNTEKELRPGQMEANMKVIMDLEENMELEHINGVMVHNILENGKKIKYLALAYIPG